MKRSIVTAAVLSALFVSAGAFAADSEGAAEGELIITGKVVGTTCKFIDGNKAIIDMNEIGKDVLNRLSPGQAYTAYKNDTITPLKVKCDNNEAPTITFSTSQFDSVNKKVTRNTASQNGVGFVVLYDGNEIDPETGLKLTGNDKGEYTLNFSAQYARLAPLNTDVEQGPVASSLTLTVVTD
ncbi:fimbrial protein YehD [Pseudenterobacter timonensis]|uniref:Fimbrial protein YehD n=1 Tax=Pseudenterobacter timonensis TaxID=1755099 RepID=A0ABV4A6Z4_9ENTR